MNKPRNLSEVASLTSNEWLEIKVLNTPEVFTNVVAFVVSKKLDHSRQVVVGISIVLIILGLVRVDSRIRQAISRAIFELLA